MYLVSFFGYKRCKNIKNNTSTTHEKLFTKSVCFKLKYLLKTKVSNRSYVQNSDTMFHFLDLCQPKNNWFLANLYQRRNSISNLLPFVRTFKNKSFIWCVYLRNKGLSKSLIIVLLLDYLLSCVFLKI